MQSEVAPFHEQTLSLLDAELTYHGFSDRIRSDSTHPETYDYQQTSQSPKWPPLRGRLTQYGECTEFVREWDDAMVVMGAGDELRFRVSLPANPLPVGWKRDFIVNSVGWDKDADLNTLAGQSIGPLPFRGMAAYPPGVDDRERAERVLELNQRSLQRSQSFRAFWYRDEGRQ